MTTATNEATTEEISTAAARSAVVYQGTRTSAGTAKDREYAAHIDGWTACRDFLAKRDETVAYRAILTALPPDVRYHWEAQEQERALMGDHGCVCYLCRTINNARKAEA